MLNSYHHHSTQTVEVSCTFVVSGEGEARHRLQAVGAAHDQRTGAPLRLGGAGGGPGTQAVYRPAEQTQGFICNVAT